MDFVFLGSNGTRLSIQLLTDVAQGKGNQIDSEIVGLIFFLLKKIILNFLNLKYN
jgi:hypothetical protein